MLIKIADDNVGTIICNGIETYSVKCQFTVFDFDTDVFAHLSIDLSMIHRAAAFIEISNR